MLIVAGKLYVDPDERDEYVDACAVVVEQAREAAGCLDFALTADPIEPGRVNVYERWESEAHLEEFRGSGPEFEHAARILSAEMEKYRVSSVGPP